MQQRMAIFYSCTSDTRTHTHTHTYTHTHTHTHKHTHKHKHKQARERAYTYLHVHTHVHIHARTGTRTHVYPYIYTYRTLALYCPQSPVMALNVLQIRSALASPPMQNISHKKVSGQRFTDRETYGIPWRYKMSYLRENPTSASSEANTHNTSNTPNLGSQTISLSCTFFAHSKILPSLHTLFQGASFD